MAERMPFTGGSSLERRRLLRVVGQRQACVSPVERSMSHIFDAKFNGMARSEMYRAQLMPDLFPYERPMMLENWPIEDLVAYCGGEYAYVEGV